MRDLGEFSEKLTLLSLENNETWAGPGHLREMFATLIGLASPQMNLCLFIDGPDEVEGDPGDIAEFFGEMDSQHTSPWVKSCLSSRSWPTFEAVFCDKLSLRLQDLTVDDIRTYVGGTLGVNKSVQKTLRHEPDTKRRFAEDIVERAWASSCGCRC